MDLKAQESLDYQPGQDFQQVLVAQKVQVVQKALFPQMDPKVLKDQAVHLVQLVQEVLAAPEVPVALLVQKVQEGRKILYHPATL